jgi:hypothetical protein
VGIVVPTTGVNGTGGVGTVTAVGSAIATPTGVEGTALTKQVLVWGPVDDDQTPNWSTQKTSGNFEKTRRVDEKTEEQRSEKVNGNLCKRFTPQRNRHRG